VQGYYLVETSRLAALASKDLSASLLTPFPHTSLPSDPATRFSELFLTRPKWRPDDMGPFLRTLVKAGDTKVRDKMVAKFVRIVKEKDGVWWYPRRTA
jgi:sister chromatid cohesion protein DCC1